MEINVIEEGFKYSLIKNAIENLRLKKFPLYQCGDNITEYIETIGNLISEDLSFYPPILFQEFFYNNFPIKSFYRARKRTEIDNYQLIREHSYPPVSKVGLQRCNFPKHPVFYCSMNPKTAIKEVHRNNSNQAKDYCVSKWEIINTPEKIFFENLLATRLPESNIYKKVGDNKLNNINKPFEETFHSKLNEDSINGIKAFLIYLNKLFIESNDYSISAYISHQSIYAIHNHKTDILMYPSVQDNLNDVNFAIHPNFVENRMKLSRLYLINYDNNEFNLYKCFENINSVFFEVNPESSNFNEFINDFNA